MVQCNSSTHVHDGGDWGLSALNNRDPSTRHPVTIVIADEVHERTMYTQMIIGLTRLQMEMDLMSATVDVADSRQS